MISLGDILVEGKYDSITRKVVRDAMRIVTGSSDRKKSVELGTYKLKSKLDFDVDLTVIRGYDFKIRDMVHAMSHADTGLIELHILINFADEPNIYSTLQSELVDTVRHEIEHLTQSGLNVVPGKPRRTGEKLRSKIEAGDLPAYKYFILKDEVPPMVRGLYMKAKNNKTALTHEMSNYLARYDDLVTKQEKKKIMKVWMAYALKHLPNARFE